MQALLSLVVSLFCASLLAAPFFEPMPGVPSGLTTRPQLATPTGRAMGTRTERLSFGSLQFQETWDRQWMATLPGARVFSKELMPQVPIVDQSISLPWGETAKVSLANVQVEATTQAFPMAMEPDLFIWQPLNSLHFPPLVTGRYFPGTFIRAADDGNKLNVHFFPMQYDRTSGLVIALKSADLKIEYVERPVAFRAQSMWGSESLIVTTQSMEDAAQELADFQLGQSGVHSEIVTVESIAQSEAPIEEEDLPDGYKQREQGAEAVVTYNPQAHTGYNYDLARKIDNFLRKRMGDGTPLKYVTLLGDATMVPPSYYFSIPSDFGSQFGVTDWCYGARDKCSDPRLAVGRLPFQNKEQLENYLSKVERWTRAAPASNSEISLFGGKAFESEVFIGELAALGILNSEKVNWFGAKKFFRTKQNYNKHIVMNMLQGNNSSPFVYYLDHGIGNQWMVERDYVSTNDILNITGSGSQINPVIVSLSCSNAAFDIELSKDVVFATTRHGKVSVGVALLRSQGGSVAYWGAGRPSIGNPIYSVDANGNLTLSGGNYTLQMMDNFFDKYREANSGTLGGLMLAATRSYLYEEGNDMTDPKNHWTYLNMVLLGDPTLQLPTREKFDPAYPVAKSTTKFTGMGPVGFPEFIFNAIQSFDFTFNAPAAVNETLLSISRTGFASGDKVLEQRAVSAGTGSTTVKQTPGQTDVSRYFVRLENAEGVPLERQVWFETRGVRTTGGSGGSNRPVVPRNTPIWQ